MVDKTNTPKQLGLDEVIARTSFLTSTQKQKFYTALIEVPRYTPEYISRFFEKHEISMANQIECMNLLVAKGTNFQTMEMLIQNGYNLQQIDRVLDIHRNNLPSYIRTTVREIDNDPEHVPDLRDFISYDHIIFLDSITGRNVDNKMIQHYIDKVTEFIDDNNLPIGVGEALYEIEETYARLKNNMTFDAAIIQALNKIPEDNLNIEQLEELDDSSLCFDRFCNGDPGYK
ncbi:TPA: hypothetical protein HA235_03590 [Candidatus Woesearchaeota archaeon]|nr:hypothetical protein [Candidatus Woesearchaeota archaeon]HIH31764.1 hypothetical protein [Candidatus Woesearchaeota archaeon]HIH54675.1 hypothetical protein [Candidatus Woesearchaeota archaeon]HIJ01562.1 hypothetical protein [Candidatus Woesearchaeota archaeon]HIJ13965.1 hypothetical protein [Candidatus Woesearchaeota archaeon]